MFRIDPVRFQYALQQATAVVTSKESAAQEALREYNRYRQLNNLEVSVEVQQQSDARVIALAIAPGRQRHRPPE